MCTPVALPWGLDAQAGGRWVCREGSCSMWPFRMDVKSLAQRRDVRRLVKALRSRNDRARRDAARALGKMRAPQSVVHLCGVLRDASADVRSAAAVALGEIGDTSAVEDLCVLLGDSDVGVRQRTAAALEAIGDARALTPLLAACRDGAASVRRGAVYALGKIRDSGAVASLIELLSDSDPGVRTAAMEALGTIGDARAVQPLCALLSSVPYSLRGTIAKALGEIGDARAVAHLLPLASGYESGPYDPSGLAKAALEKIAAADPNAHVRELLRQRQQEVASRQRAQEAKLAAERRRQEREARSRPPVIRAGMATAEVIRLLGTPRSKTSKNEIFGVAGMSVTLIDVSGSLGTEEYWGFDHPAGTYQLVVNDDRVTRVHSQPSPSR